LRLDWEKTVFQFVGDFRLNLRLQFVHGRY
jgi:hypothetical protein